MLKKNKITTVLCILVFIALGVASTAQQQQKERPKNLLILPKDISEGALDTIMHNYNDALGVKCNYCHSPINKDNPKDLDYASDSKAAKRISRDMMKMTKAINEQFFKDHVNDKGEASEAISCISCHNGQEYPAFTK
ncbi:c-type cytochrome [Hufsiella ginkgonis]|uniref:Photosynthetic reaction center cytochrome c subunit n=1 Tax=Hufsiella ginkgonis TaxID=2695274 RepID=A0A7K1XZC8_9SPHI|nr:c-type cytochrome [Hufsiella ginkgonis]MXV16158.1 c-type cytochrome [Hufsiella ginkgonis]